LQCTQAEICDFFDVTDKTLNSWCKREYGSGFSEVFSKKRSAGKISLRRMQFQLAEKSASMAIFLGKQYLGQRDVVEQINTKQEEQHNALIDAIKARNGSKADGNED
jgi:hypothetical protein